MKRVVWTLLTLCVFNMECFSQQKESSILTEEERINRLMLDFSKTEADIIRELAVYDLHKDQDRIRKWELENKIENKVIDGEKRYFKNAVPNLFRLDSQAYAVKKSVDPSRNEDVWTRIPRETAIKMIDKKIQDSVLFAPESFEISISISVPVSNLTSDDRIVKCWIPAPQLNSSRQMQVMYVSDPAQQDENMRKKNSHASVYKEETAPFDSEFISFESKYIISAYAQHYSLAYLYKHEKKQNANTYIYKKFTSERNSHVIFTPRIKELGDSLKDENSDVRTIKNIFDYISSNIPWCSALEYSNIDNIPMYVLDNRHGDCGQVSLLFITLCRYCGIPAKWQSGWMLHPGAENLHDWAEVLIEGVGWIPVDVSFGRIDHPDLDIAYYYLGGIDPYRFVINEDFSSEFDPAKMFFRSEPVDFQRGEVETNQRNLYFNKWKYKMSAKNILR